jgi:hypothetical protein
MTKKPAARLIIDASIPEEGLECDNNTFPVTIGGTFTVSGSANFHFR